MKRVLILLLVLTVLGTSVVYAADMGVQIISAPEEVVDAEPVSMDDVKLGKEMEIDKFGIVIFNTFEYKDKLSNWSSSSFKSGEEADYALIQLDITNTQKISKDFLKTCEIKAFYDDEYEFGGFSYQYNYDKSKDNVIKEPYEIDPLYVGHYLFGCTLPNFVVNSEKPLRIEISIDENKFTYHVRK